MRHYSAYLFIGILAWNLFAGAIQSSSGVIIRQASLVKKIYFPREILPLSVVGGALINFLLSWVILIPYLLVSGFYPRLEWLWALPATFLEVTLITGLSLLVSAITVYLRDVEHILGILMMAWFYVTPVVYSLSMVPKRYDLIFKLNPATASISTFQEVFYYGSTVHWKIFVYGIFIAVVVLFAGYITFIKLSRRFAEEV